VDPDALARAAAAELVVDREDQVAREQRGLEAVFTSFVDSGTTTTTTDGYDIAVFC